MRGGNDKGEIVRADDPAVRLLGLMVSAMIGISTVIVVQLVAIDYAELDRALKMALAFFAVAIPLLVKAGMVCPQNADFKCPLNAA
jgi:hypothetical protein